MFLGNKPAVFRSGRKAKLIAACLFFLLFTIAEAYAVVSGQKLWAKRYNSSAAKDDVAVAAAVGPNGTLYVTGSSAGDYATIKYAPNGGAQWVRRYDGPRAGGDDQARALAVDRLGYAYVAGASP